MQLTLTDVFDALFGGTGYRTIGYYKTDSDTPAQALRNMTARVAEISEMRPDSHVLDLGCGHGIPVLDIAVNSGCSVVGIDLADEHIVLAKNAADLYKKEKKADLKAEFYAASYFDLPDAVTNQKFTHVMMQTSMFYAHNRIDELLALISKVMHPSGILVSTDYLKASDTSDTSKFMEANEMPVMLSLDQLESALIRNGFEYSEGENLDSHCLKSSESKIDKIVQEGIPCPAVNLFKLMKGLVMNSQLTFQLIVATKSAS